MLKRSLKRRLTRARITLRDTLQEILEVNRKRKKLTAIRSRKPRLQERKVNEELRVLNKIAKRQANLIEYYERNLRDSA